jgi:hypothetical protein
MANVHLNYHLRRALSTRALLHEALAYKAVLSEALFSRNSGTLITETVPFREADEVPAAPLRFIVPHAGRNQGHPALRFSIVDFGDKNIKSWNVPLPPSRKANALFKAHIKRYQPAYLRLRLPFMGAGIPHCAHVSKAGYICASNGFYNHVINTRLDQARAFPEDYLTATPMHYSKQGNFSSDGLYWYFVRWPLVGWADMIDGKADTVPCQVGRIFLPELREEVLLDIDYQEETHEIACSPDDRHAVFCTFKQELCLPYPRASFFSSRHGYKLSHEAGMKTQQLVTVDLQTSRHWFTKIPAPVIGHHVFDPDDPNVFYSSAHNVVFHELNAILEGPATLIKFRIADGRTVVEKKYSDDQFLRIFQHEVFKYRNETYIAVMSYPRYLYILHAQDLDLYKKIEISPAAHVEFGETGSALCERSRGVYFTVNASDDGRFIVLGSDADFLMFDMATDEILDLHKHLPREFGIGESIPHTRTCGR